MALRYVFAFLVAVSGLFPALANAQSLIAPTDKFPHYLQHYVRERETPSSIAHDFNVKTKDFLALNNFPDNVRLKPGQVVLIRLLKEGEAQSQEAPYVPPTTDEPVAKEEPATYEKPATKPAPAEKTERIEKTTVTKTVTKTETTAKPASAGTVEVGPNGAKYEKTNTGYHTVEKGQTFYHIAIMYGLTVDKLKALNNMSNTNIEIGQKLKVQ